MLTTPGIKLQYLALHTWNNIDVPDTNHTRKSTAEQNRPNMMKSDKRYVFVCLLLHVNE